MSASIESRLRVKWLFLIVGALVLIYLVDQYTIEALPQWNGRYGSGDPDDSPLWANIVIGALAVGFGGVLVALGAQGLVDRRVKLRIDDKGLFWVLDPGDRSGRTIRFADIRSAEIRSEHRAGVKLYLTVADSGGREEHMVHIGELDVNNQALIAALKSRGVPMA